MKVGGIHNTISKTQHKDKKWVNNNKINSLRYSSEYKIYAPIFNLKEGDGIKWKETRQGWMDRCCHSDNLRNLLINRHMSYIVTADQIVSMTINRACVC